MVTSMINLQGLRILNTRPQGQNEALNRLISAANGKALSCPTLAIYSTPSSWLDRLPPLQSIDQAIFISPNAVDFSFTQFREKKLSWPLHIETFAIGKATALALENFGVKPKAIPKEANSEALLKIPSLIHCQNKRIVLFKGKEGLNLISKALKERQAKLIELEVYERRLPFLDPSYTKAIQAKQNPLVYKTEPHTLNQAQLNHWWKHDEVDLIIYTSAQIMENTFILFGLKACSWLRQKPSLVLSQRLALVAQKLGIKTIMVCNFSNILTTLDLFKKGLMGSFDTRIFS